MTDRAVRLIAAVVVPVVALVVAQWYDAGVLFDVKNKAGLTFDPNPVLYGVSIAYVLTGASALAIAAAAWFSRSSLVGLAYALVGGFIALVPALFAWLAMSVNGGPTLAPEPIARFIQDRWVELSKGVTGSAYVLGAVMLASGVAVLVARVMDSRRPAGPVRPEPVESQPPER